MNDDAPAPVRIPLLDPSRDRGALVYLACVVAAFELVGRLVHGSTPDELGLLVEVGVGVALLVGLLCFHEARPIGFLRRWKRQRLSWRRTGRDRAHGKRLRRALVLRWNLELRPTSNPAPAGCRART